jgi:hypothetical protein
MWSDVSADPWLVLGAAAIEAVVGYPDGLHRRAPHPVVWMGGLIAWCDRTWNREDGSPKMRRVLGVATLVMIMAVAGVAGWLPSLAPAPFALGLVLLAGVLGLAQRSLFDHVRAVAKPLASGDISAARLAVGAIVGRDVAELDEPGVAAAALESLAESFNDGVVAPIFWFVVGGLPGLFRLQGGQYRGQPDRPSRAALARFRLGLGADGRSDEPDPGSDRRLPDRLAGKAVGGSWRATPAARLAQLRLAGSRHGRRLEESTGRFRLL